MRPRSLALPLVLAGGLVLLLATMEPAVGLFTQTFRTVGAVASEPPTPTATAATPAARTAFVSKTPHLPSTPGVTTTATASPATKPGSIATAIATPFVPPAARTAVLPPPATAMPASTALATPAPTTTATLTPTSTAVACPPRGLSLAFEPAPTPAASSSAATTAQRGLVLANKGTLALPADTVLRVTPLTAGERIGRLTLLGTTWTPAGDKDHEWKLPLLAAGVSLPVQPLVEEKPAPLAAVSAANATAGKLRLDIVLACGAGEAVLATAEAGWTSPARTPTAVPATVRPATAVPILTAIPVVTAKPVSVAPAEKAASSSTTSDTKAVPAR